MIENVFVLADEIYDQRTCIQCGKNWVGPSSHLCTTCTRESMGVFFHHNGVKSNKEFSYGDSQSELYTKRGSYSLR